MISCELMGGLGNQLFQIFATICYAMKHRQPFKFLYKDFLVNRPTYWNTFLNPLKVFTMKQRPTMTVINETGFRFQLIQDPAEGEDSTLKGYFQSHKYFEEHWSTLSRLIRLEEQKAAVKSMFNDNYDNIVSMHFRLGDYKYLQDCHPIIKYSYYKNSIQHIINARENDKLKILYFCEKSDVDDVLLIIKQLKEKFTECTFVMIDHDNFDWVQMLMMSLCRDNIIANSTFSWWGAYFNSREDKIVCYPDVWFGPKLASINDTSDLFPEKWTKISSDE
jgi:hypothetical protein